MFLAACLLVCLQLIRGKPLELLHGNDTRPLCPCGKNPSSVHTRVVGGYPVGRSKFPYATGLIFNPYEDFRGASISPFCGGTLITDRHVLTAAHCLKDRSPNDISVDVGDYDLRDENEGRIIAPRKLVKYPEYQIGSFHTDMGIVELEEPVSFDSGIRPAPLLSPDLALKPGTTVIVYGWGRLDYTSGHPHELHAVDLPVVANEECKPKFHSEIESNMICAGGVEGKDACIGDSGSGLVVQLDNDFVLCGVVSFGRRCALPDVPGVYTRVSSFLDWILENTETAGCRPCIYGENEE